jgi:hypothetical protein
LEIKKGGYVQQVNLKIRHPRPDPLYILTDIKHNTRKKIKDERETYRKKG